MAIPWAAPYDPEGKVALWQYRPDHPWADEAGRPVKYVFPSGASPGLAVHPRVRAPEDVDALLYITEGVAKADALISGRLLRGVGGRGVELDAQREPHPHLDLVKWNGRLVFLVPDADTSTNPSVWKGIKGLWTTLRQRGAEVRLVVVPPVNNDDHTGVDDFLAYHLAADPEATPDDIVEALADVALTGCRSSPRPTARW